MYEREQEGEGLLDVGFNLMHVVVPCSGDIADTGSYGSAAGVCSFGFGNRGYGVGDVCAIYEEECRGEGEENEA